MTIISFIAINFGAIYRTTKSSYRDSPSSYYLKNPDQSQLIGSEREPIRATFPKSIGTSALYELLRLITMLLRDAAQDSRFRL